MEKKFADPGQLVEWLEENGIDVASWGSGPYKSIANLWDEYQEGEVFFEDDPPLRVVKVVQIVIQQGEKFLFEIEQLLNNGERRFRNQPPAEKIKGGETGLDAAYRCMREELGLNREQISEISAVGESDEEISGSPSYPGLPTRYRVYEIEAHVDGLPDEDFWRENRAAAEGDPVDKHLWGWRTVG